MPRVRPCRGHAQEWDAQNVGVHGLDDVGHPEGRVDGEPAVAAEVREGNRRLHGHVITLRSAAIRRPARPCFQGLVHLFEAAPRIGIQSAGKQGNEQPREDFALGEAHATLSKRFDGEAVLAVKKPGYQEMAQPPQLPVRLGFENGGPEGHAACPGRLDVDFEPFPHPDVSACFADKRVPLGKTGKVGEELPHPFRRCLDFNLGAKFFHGCLLTPSNACLT